MSYPAVDITSFVSGAMQWAVPLIATIFFAGWGIRLVFGRRR